VLQGSGLGDVAVVVTRYFGGTKLGTGGLVRAYGDAVREVLSVLPRAMRVPSYTVSVALPYGSFEPVCRLIEAHGGEILDQDFGVDVTVQARFPQEHYSAFRAALREASSARLAPTIVSEGEVLVPI
jgi:putative IMPACT (imprinted ancient) family translation regulator